MFGKKEKKQQATQAKVAQQRVPAGIPVTPVQRPVYVQPMPEQKVFYESEIIKDDEEDVVEIELLLDTESLKAIQPDRQSGVDDIIVGDPVEINEADKQEEPVLEPIVEEEPEEPVKEEKPQEEKVEKEPKQAEPQNPNNIIYVTNTVVAPQPYQQAPPAEEKKEAVEPEVRYVYDTPEEEEDVVKPARLVKLPNLVDYMLSLKISKRMLMNVATLLLGAYAKFKDIPAEKAILIGCMKKIMVALMNAK